MNKNGKILPNDKIRLKLIREILDEARRINNMGFGFIRIGLEVEEDPDFDEVLDPFEELRNDSYTGSYTFYV